MHESDAPAITAETPRGGHRIDLEACLAPAIEAEAAAQRCLDRLTMDHIDEARRAEEH